jgi:hypothetical protein
MQEQKLSYLRIQQASDTQVAFGDIERRVQTVSIGLLAQSRNIHQVLLNIIDDRQERMTVAPRRSEVADLDMLG